MTVTVKQALEQTRDLLEISDTWRLDGELLLAASTGSSRVSLLARPEQELTSDQQQLFNEMLQRRMSGEPIAYILGHREFWDLNLRVDQRVLIPRPETELLVELALQLLEGREPQSLHIADLGTGSGAIALVLARQRPQWQMLACDISSDALIVAGGNAAALQIPNVEFLQCSWGTGLPTDHFDLIVSNPPYVSADDEHINRGDLVFEPRLALVASDDGLASFISIAEQCLGLLKKDAWLLLEHGYLQKHSVVEILAKAGYREISSWQDLAGLDRVTGGRR